MLAFKVKHAKMEMDFFVVCDLIKNEKYESSRKIEFTFNFINYLLCLFCKGHTLNIKSLLFSILYFFMDFYIKTYMEMMCF